MANLEYKQAVLKLTFEGGLTGDGKMKTKSKSYRNILAAATANGLDTVAITLASFSNMYINDVEIGELGLNAYVAGHFGVPVIMVAGDDGACKEAEALIPGVVTAVVKESISRSAVKTLHPQKAHALLREKVAVAISNRDQIKPLTPPKNPTLRIEFVNYGQAEWAALQIKKILRSNT